jgi:hypothetical protein
MAIGILVVLSGDDFKDSQKAAMEGKKYPEKTPINIARKIHRVKYLSRNLSRVFEGMVGNLKIWKCENLRVWKCEKC